jgi:hypothetical protein
MARPCKREKGEERGGNSLLGFAIREKKRESAVVRGEGGCHVLAWMCSSQRSRKKNKGVREKEMWWW